MPDASPNTLDDDVAAVQAGDTAAFRAVVDRVLRPVQAFVVSRSLPGVDVDDVVQRAFIEAYKNISDYTIGTDFVAWVVTIARYQLLMETSRLRRRADYHSRYAPHAMAEAVETRLQSDATETESRLEHLRDCLATLPDASRQVLAQRYENVTPIDDIARSLNRSAGAVRKQLCLLRKQLHECVTRKLAQEQHA